MPRTRKLVVEVPEPVTYEHLGLFRICSPDCPLHRNDEQSGFDCTGGYAYWSAIPEPNIVPSKGCPWHDKREEGKRC